MLDFLSGFCMYLIGFFLSSLRVFTIFHDFSRFFTIFTIFYDFNFIAIFEEDLIE